MGGQGALLGWGSGGALGGQGALLGGPGGGGGGQGALLTGGQGALFLGGGQGALFEVLVQSGIGPKLYYMAESVPAGWDPPQPTLSSERQGRIGKKKRKIFKKNKKILKK